MTLTASLNARSMLISHAQTSCCTNVTRSTPRKQIPQNCRHVRSRQARLIMYLLTPHMNNSDIQHRQTDTHTKAKGHNHVMPLRPVAKNSLLYFNSPSLICLKNVPATQNSSPEIPWAFANSPLSLSPEGTLSGSGADSYPLRNGYSNSSHPPHNNWLGRPRYFTGTRLGGAFGGRAFGENRSGEGTCAGV